GLSGKRAQGRRPANVSGDHPETVADQGRKPRPGEGQTPDRQVMKLSDLLKSPSSFRVQMVAFIALMLMLTMAVIAFYNQRVEERTTSVVNEYIREIPLAIDLVLRSLDKGEYLYNLVNHKDQNSLAINSESIVRRIFIVNEEDKIFDS